MNMKTMLCVATSALSAMLMASDTPEVSNVQMRQSSTGRKVTIKYELSNAANGAVVTLDVETNKTGSATNNDADWVSIGGAAVCNAQGAVWRKVTSADVDGNGLYTITWRPDHSWEGHKVELANGGARAVVTAWALDNTPDYMVVDVSAGAQPNTQRYYPAADFLPGGVSNGLYKTTTLLMRKIMAKDVTWTMGSTTLETQRVPAKEATHQVALTNNYYIGVFEITQSQWGLIQPDRSAPSYFANVADRAMRPVEQVSYNEIRNAANSTVANTAYYWPADPNPDSALGKLRAKTGINFDLPSESQWEFAARAGNGSTKWGDGSAILNTDQDQNLDLLGRYYKNPTSNSLSSPAANVASSQGGTAIVGSYAPNAWGLYDTAGNVWEWCLDWCVDDITAHGGKVNIDPASSANPLSGTSAIRVIRGGCWGNKAGDCRPACRVGLNPTNNSFNGAGFRVVCTAGLR